jgi:PAS domain-containing protein
LAEHEQLRAAELESVIGAIGEGIVVCGRDGSVRSTNDAAERILGGRIADLEALRSLVDLPGGLQTEKPAWNRALVRDPLPSNDQLTVTKRAL